MGKHKCEKCGGLFELGDCMDLVLLKRHEDGTKQQVGKIRLCDDCAEKAETTLADALEVPGWD